MVEADYHSQNFQSYFENDNESSEYYSAESFIEPKECYYCKYDDGCLIKCNIDNCRKWFCNDITTRGLNQSHIYSHMVFSKHTSITPDLQIWGYDQFLDNIEDEHPGKLECFRCRCSNSFSLGVLVDSRQIICRVPCLVELNSDNYSWKSIFKDKTLNIRLLCTLPRFSRRHFIRPQTIRKRVSAEDIKIIEDQMQNVDHISNFFIEETKTIYNNIEDYLKTFRHLLELEVEEEINEKKKLSLFDVNLIAEGSSAYFYGMEYGCRFNEKHVVTFENYKARFKENTRIERKKYGKFYISLNNRFEGTLKVNMFINDETQNKINYIPAKRIIEELNNFHSSSGKIDEDIKNIVLGIERKIRLECCIIKNDYSIPEIISLNGSQNSAVRKAFKYKFSIIQGPPGTGKTHTISGIAINIDNLCRNSDFKQKIINEINIRVAKITDSRKNIVFNRSQKISLIEKTYNKDDSILICAHSNIPIILLKERLRFYGLDALIVFARCREQDFINDRDSLHYKVNTALRENQEFQEKSRNSNIGTENRFNNKKKSYLWYEEAEKNIKKYKIILCTCISVTRYLFEKKKI